MRRRELADRGGGVPQTRAPSQFGQSLRTCPASPHLPQFGLPSAVQRSLRSLRLGVLWSCRRRRHPLRRDDASRRGRRRVHGAAEDGSPDVSAVHQRLRGKRPRHVRRSGPQSASAQQYPGCRRKLRPSARRLASPRTRDARGTLSGPRPRRTARRCEAGALAGHPPKGRARCGASHTNGPLRVHRAELCAASPWRARACRRIHATPGAFASAPRPRGAQRRRRTRAPTLKKWARRSRRLSQLRRSLG